MNPTFYVLSCYPPTQELIANATAYEKNATKGNGIDDTEERKLKHYGNAIMYFYNTQH